MVGLALQMRVVVMWLICNEMCYYENTEIIWAARFMSCLENHVLGVLVCVTVKVHVREEWMVGRGLWRNEVILCSEVLFFKIFCSLLPPKANISL